MSGRQWIVDEMGGQAGLGRRTTPYWGWEPNTPERRVWVQRLVHGDEWDEDRQHLRRAYELGTKPEIANSPHILRVLDLIEEWDTYLVSEYADTTLDVALKSGPLPGDELVELEDALRKALDLLHALNLVHGDVREDNVFRVEGRWKLGDLGSAVDVGDPIVTLPRDRSYVPEGVEFGSRAKVDFDHHALAVVLHHAHVGLL